MKTPCPHPDERQRSWAVIPNLRLDWCERCGALRFNDRWIQADTSHTAEELDRLPLEQALRDPVYADGFFNEASALEQARGPIHIDARRFFEAGRPEPQRFFRCGNCGAKLPMTGDLEKDHHTARAHSIEACEKRIEAAMDHRALIAEMKERNERPLQIGDGRPWWKFW